MADGVLDPLAGKRHLCTKPEKVENALLTVSGFTDSGVSQGKATKEKVIEQERVSAAPFCEAEHPRKTAKCSISAGDDLDKEPLFIDSSYDRCRVILTLMRFTSKEAPPISYFRSVSTREWSATKRPSISLPPPARRQNGSNANWANRCFASAKSPLIRMTNRCTSPNSSAAPIASP